MKKTAILFWVVVVFGGGDWERMVLPSVHLMDIDVAATNSDYVYVVTDVEIYRTTDRGDSWTVITPPDVYLPYAYSGGVQLEVSYEDERLIYVYKIFDGFYRSINGGDSWIRTSDYEAWALNTFEVPKGNSEMVYITARSGMGGFHLLRKLSPYGGFYENLFDCRAFAVSPLDTNLIYASTYAMNVSTDNGETWSSGDSIPILYPTEYEIHIDPYSPEIAYFTTANYAYKNDMGRNFYNLERSIEFVYEVVINYCNPYNVAFLVGPYSPYQPVNLIISSSSRATHFDTLFSEPVFNTAFIRNLGI